VVLIAVRKIIKIDENKCNGCGLCVPSCAEGAIQIIEGKARLIDDKFCDGLGACLGDCPNDAITIIEREAKEFDEEAVESHIKEDKDNNSYKDEETACACPSCSVTTFEKEKEPIISEKKQKSVSRLSHWPIQLKLTPPEAPFFKDANLLISADCVPFAYSNFHEDFIKDKTVVIGCPKLDEIDFYIKRLTEIFCCSNIKSVTIVRMDVACCSGLTWATKQAIAASGKDIPVTETVISAKEGSVIKNHL